MHDQPEPVHRQPGGGPATPGLAARPALHLAGLAGARRGRGRLDPPRRGKGQPALPAGR
mgnify:CR=1 FL=1